MNVFNIALSAIRRNKPVPVPTKAPRPYKPGTHVIMIDGTQYSVSKTGAWIRITPRRHESPGRTSELDGHNNSVRRRLKAHHE